MADWRQNETGKPARKPKTVAKPSGGSSPAGSTNASKGWRNKKASAASPATTSQAYASRSWTGASPQDVAPVSAGALRKWILVGGLFLLATAGFIVLVIAAFRRPERLRMVVLSAADYQSPELLSNPYADLQRSRLEQVNTTNVKALSTDDPSKSVSTLSSDAFLQSIESGKTTTIPVGGPSKKFVAFYVNSFATFDAQNRIHLQAPTDSPFTGLATSGGVPLAQALGQMAAAVQPGAYAWVVLDLQLPPMLNNLGDLDRPWATATRAAIAGLDTELQDRLLVTLPCDDGQSNWLAPECSSSFFGYYIRELLAGRDVGAKISAPELSVDEFSVLLGKRTAYTVARRRFATQTPVWLPDANFEAAKSRGLVTIRPTDADKANATLPSEEHFAAIDTLWQRLAGEQYQEAYRWDPLGYAAAESQLLGLENIAIYQPSKFATAKDRVVEAIGAIKRPQVLWGVSLVEDRTRDLFFHGNQPIRDHAKVGLLAKQLSSQISSAGPLPSFWEAPAANSPEVAVDADAEAKPKPIEEGLQAALRAELVWQLFVEASAGDFKQWAAVFQADRLEKALAYAGQTEPTCVEMNLLKRLARDIDWYAVSLPASENRNTTPACAQAVTLFDRIQTITSYPNCQGFGTQAERLREIEAQYMRGVDWLLANQFDSARKEFAAVEQSLTPVERTQESLAKMIGNANRTLYLAPHLLGWMMREYPLASRAEATTIERQLRELAMAVNQTADLYRVLEQASSGPLPSGMEDEAEQMADSLANLEDSFAKYVERNTSVSDAEKASGSPLSFRRGRIALLSPLTRIEVRAALHKQIGVYLDVDVDANFDENSQALPAQATSSKAAQTFLASLDADQVKWAPLVQSDVRDGISDRLSFTPGVSSASPSSLLIDFLKAEYWLRVYASHFGSNPTLQGRLSTMDMDRDGLPWTAAWQRWVLAEAMQCKSQAHRLASASWGDGVVTDATSSEQVFFRRMAERYVYPGDLVRLEPANSVANQLTAARKATQDAGLLRLKELRVDFGDVRKVDLAAGQQLIPLRVQSSEWDAIANVYLEHAGRRQPWLKNAMADRSWVVDIRNQAALSVQKFLDTSYWAQASQPPTGVIAIRGNVRLSPLDWEISETKLTPYVLELERERPNGATLVVRSPDEPPTINAMLLIDCSSSMATRVSDVIEGAAGATGEVEVFDKVKRNVRAILRELSQIHGREANVQLSVMPFGLKAADAAQMKSFLLARNDDLNVFRSDFRPLDNGWLADIEGAIDGLSPSGDTPLYSAISEACDVARLRNGERTFIYVFSDGVNHINEGATELAQKSTRDVERAIRQSNDVFVSVFHFDFFQEWIVQSEFDANLAQRWKTDVFKPGMDELDALSTRLKKQFNYSNSRNDKKLLDDSLALLPSAKVQVFAKRDPQIALAETKLDEPIHMPQGALPEQYDVKVQGELGEAGAAIELMGGEMVELQLKQSSPRLQHVAIDFNRKNPPSRSSERLGSEAFLFPRLERLSIENELGLAIDFGKGDSNQFTYRPKFLVAEVSRIDERAAPTIVLADYWFTSQISYPQAQLGFFDWPESRPVANVRVWAADAIPKLLQLITVAAGDVIEPDDSAGPRLPGSQVRIEHRGDLVSVSVEYDKRPTPQQRVVIICPANVKARREFQQSQMSETHSFWLAQDSVNQSVLLQFATIADLEASRKSDLTEFVFRPVETR